jgi:hypothetical protein
MDENKEYLDEVEEEVDESVEDEEDFTEDNEEFTDSADEDADDEEASEEEDDIETEDESEENKDNNADSNADEESGEEEAEEKTNSYQAQKRREREAREEKLKKDAFVKGMIEALGGENPYTGEKIEDSADVDEYLMMRELEKQGHDPVADYHKAVKRKAKESVSQAKEEQERKQEIFEFSEKYPDVDMQTLLSNEKFVRFAGKRVGRESLSDIYADYLSFTSEYDAEANRKAEEKQKEKAARKKASPGSLTGNGDSAKQSYETMSDKAFERKLAAVLRGTEKI